MKHGLYEDLGEIEYLHDPDSISASTAKQILKSPAHLKLPQWFSDAADLGSAFHTEALGVGQEVVVVDAASWRGKEANAAQAAARAEGKAPILTKDVATVKAMAKAVHEHPTAGALLNQPGRPELSAFWRDEEWGLTRRARVDYLTDSGVNVDLKSTVSVDPHAIQRKVIDLGYDLSLAWYEDVLRGLDVDLAASALVFCEKVAPYRVRVVELSPEFIDRGRVLANRALTIYRECVERDEWPAYDNPDFTTLTLPRWAQLTEETPA